MPQRRLHSWTPGSPIDGQKMRVYRNGGLAGTYEMSNTATEQIIDVVDNSQYSAGIVSLFETQESTPLSVMFNTYGGPYGAMLGLWTWFKSLFAGRATFGEYVPPPTGTIQVSVYP